MPNQKEEEEEAEPFFQRHNTTDIEKSYVESKGRSESGSLAEEEQVQNQDLHEMERWRSFTLFIGMLLNFLIKVCNL